MELKDYESVAFSSVLDAGEAEAIALAIKQNADRYYWMILQEEEQP